ncbi:MAG: hypothetical protein KDA98_03470 [Acidimicrobiales bacterium]|nr:hypothetical protein [Acidimicrobiales bacterium]
MADVAPELDRDDPVVRYLELGLRGGRHLDGMVDAYYGPAALADRVADEPLRPLDALVGDARGLVGDLDRGDGDLDPVRRRWLRAQAAGLHAALRKLAGESLGFVDEVEQCYGVRPTSWRTTCSPRPTAASTRSSPATDRWPTATRPGGPATS